MESAVLTPTATAPAAAPPVDPALAGLKERAKAPEGNPSLAEAGRVFFRYGSPRTLTVGLTLLLAARLWAGGWSVWDPVILLAYLAWQPFQEWLIHVYVLHFRPRRFLGLTLDFSLARKHRRHHVDPWNVPELFIPLGTIAFSFLFHATLFGALLPLPQALTGLVVLTGTGLTYEWIHYLTHTAYRPKSAMYRKVWQYHRLHHFKNEKYWMGVTMHLGDKVLGTLPEPRSVETSPTARTLGLS